MHAAPVDGGDPPGMPLPPVDETLREMALGVLMRVPHLMNIPGADTVQDAVGNIDLAVS